MPMLTYWAVLCAVHKLAVGTTINRNKIKQTQEVKKMCQELVVAGNTKIDEDKILFHRLVDGSLKLLVPASHHQLIIWHTVHQASGRGKLTCHIWQLRCNGTWRLVNLTFIANSGNILFAPHTSLHVCLKSFLRPSTSCRYRYILT